MQMVLGLLGGLALFLYGMNSMSEGLKNAAGARMQSILSKVTSRPIFGIAVGTLVTFVIQSSSATTVMVVSFVNAGLMTLKQAISVILGANIGTTITAQLIAFKLSDFFFIFVIVGFLISFLTKKNTAKYIGEFIFGFGILLMGLSFMSSSMEPLKDNPTFINLIVNYGDIAIIGFIIGMLLTMVLQSSSATIGILIALSFNDLLPLQTAIAVVLGLNVGTCATTLLAAIGTTITAKRAALAHLIFNVLGACLCLLILPWFTHFIEFITPANSLPVEIANAHTVFNIANTLLFYPFIGVLANFVTKLLPEKKQKKKITAQFLDERVLETPAVAINLAKQEMKHLGSMATNSLEISMNGFLTVERKAAAKVFQIEKQIDTITQEIVDYLSLISRHELTKDQAEDYTLLLHAVNDIERVGDHSENIAELLINGIDNGMKMSDIAKNQLAEMTELVVSTFKMAMEAFDEKSLTKSQEVMALENKIDDLSGSLRKLHIDRLSDGLCQPFAGIIFLDVNNNLERVGDHASNIAKIVRDIHQ